MSELLTDTHRRPVGEAMRRSGAAPTVAAALVALAVLAAVMGFVNLTGGVTRHVKTAQLSPDQHATAERLLSRQAPRRQG